MKAVIQAGGQGTRLRPYTLILPKPMMPVGGVPVIESLLKWLRRNGIEEAYVTTGYLGHLLRSLIGDGSQWDMSIAYSEEKEPMGTVGALRLVEDQLDETFLVLNGDLVTDLDLNAFRDFHRSHGGLLSIAVTSKTVKVDLGVLDTDNLSRVTRFREKPSMQYQVSMGMYCMEPKILKHIPKGVAFGFDDLVHILLEKNVPIHVFQHDGLWMDIGRPEDFQKAQELVDSNEDGFYISNNAIDKAT
ncbi:MAG: sugar phosphate nucleotidyltransferase [Methylococcales bacterium]